MSMGTENQVDSISFARHGAADGGSAPASGNDSKNVCSACGRDNPAFHRLKHDGVARHFCSSCVLFLYKGMYCCLCFVVYENPAAKGPASLWVSCARCQRIAHEKCARDRELLVDSLHFTCSRCPQSEQNLACVSKEGDAVPPLKRLRSSADDQSVCTPYPDDGRQDICRASEEVLAAAQIIALLAVQHAKDAKARARASAAVAARAAACAKAALDTAYRFSLQEARWKLDPSRRLSGVSPGSNAGLSAAINAPKSAKTDGGSSIHNPLSYSHAQHNKDQTGKGQNAGGYIPLNARVAASYNRVKALPVNPEAANAVHQNGSFEKPQKGHVQETLAVLQNEGASMEPEIISINASPASILDATASLEMPQQSSLEQSGSALCSEVAATSDTEPKMDCSSANGADLQDSRDQLSLDNQKVKEFDD